MTVGERGKPAVILIVTAGLLAGWLLLPKIILLEFVGSVLWSPFGWSDRALIHSQDLLLSAVVFLVLVLTLRRPSRLKILVGSLLVAVILALLMIDCRARQLYLKPLDAGIIDYVISNWSDLESGQDHFFKTDAGFGMTFRRMCFYVGLGYGLSCGLTALLLLRGNGAAKPATLPRPGAFLAAVGAAILALIITAWVTPQFVYHVEDNIFVRWFLIGRAKAHDSEELRKLAASFDQPTRPLGEVLAPERTILAEVAPFQNLVIVMLESVRWNGLDLAGTGPTPAPALREVAQEGLLARAYVSIPHTSKAYYAVVTGRHPYPGLEMREATAGSRHDSIMWALRDREVQTTCFTSMYLPFENTDGLLAAFGIDLRMELAPLALAMGRTIGPGSSFGAGDEVMDEVTVKHLLETNAPFATFLNPVAAHYPYVFPGKADSDGDGIKSYWRSVTYYDDQFRDLIQAFREAALSEGTLFVFVGDHGESFGEHKTTIHNNSMHEEEITVPLIFWSADGRLEQDGILSARQIDVAPTIADLMAIDAKTIPVQGVSLLRRTEIEPVYVTSFFDRVAQALIVGNDKYIYEPTAGRLLHYDLEKDPGELHPLPVDSTKREEIIQRLDAFDAYQRQAFVD